MRIRCIGGGPAALYFGLLAKKAHPDWDVRIFEGNVLVKRTSTGRYVEANDTNGDTNSPASVSASETADGDWASKTITVNVNGMDLVTVTLGAGDDTDDRSGRRRSRARRAQAGGAPGAPQGADADALRDQGPQPFFIRFVYCEIGRAHV